MSVPISTGRADLPFVSFALLPLCPSGKKRETYLTAAGFLSMLTTMFAQQQLLPDAIWSGPEEHRPWSRLD